MSELDIVYKFLEDNGFKYLGSSVPTPIDTEVSKTYKIRLSADVERFMQVYSDNKILKGVNFYGNKEFEDKYNSYVTQIKREQQLDKIL